MSSNVPSCFYQPPPDDAGQCWIGVMGAAGAVALLASTGTIFEPESVLGIFGFLVFPLFATWMLATNIILLRRSRQPQADREMAKVEDELRPSLR